MSWLIRCWRHAHLCLLAPCDPHRGEVRMGRQFRPRFFKSEEEWPCCACSDQIDPTAMIGFSSQHLQGTNMLRRSSLPLLRHVCYCRMLHIYGFRLSIEDNWATVLQAVFRRSVITVSLMPSQSLAQAVAAPLHRTWPGPRGMARQGRKCRTTRSPTAWYLLCWPAPSAFRLPPPRR